MNVIKNSLNNGLKCIRKNEAEELTQDMYVALLWYSCLDWKLLITENVLERYYAFEEESLNMALEEYGINFDGDYIFEIGRDKLDELLMNFDKKKENILKRS